MWLHCLLLHSIMLEEATARLFCLGGGFQCPGCWDVFAHKKKWSLMFRWEEGSKKPNRCRTSQWKTWASSFFFSAFLPPFQWPSFTLNLRFQVKEAHGFLQTEVMQVISAVRVSLGSFYSFSLSWTLYWDFEQLVFIALSWSPLEHIHYQVYKEGSGKQIHLLHIDANSGNPTALGISPKAHASHAVLLTYSKRCIPTPELGGAMPWSP